MKENPKKEQRDFNRRNFLKATTMLGAAAYISPVLGNNINKNSHGATKVENGADVAFNMQYRTNP